MNLEKLTKTQLRRVARKVGIKILSTEKKKDILQKLMAPLGHYSMMRDLPTDVIQNYIGPGLDTRSLANLSLASRGNQELLTDELESRRFHADDTSIRTAVKHYRRDPVEATKIYGPISSWDVSRVTDMSRMFKDALSFNGDLSNWDVSRVTDMSWMFYNTRSFNADLSNWDVSRVTDMSRLFRRATSFNGDLSNWDVSRVTDMSGMFEDALSFNGDLSNWDVSRVTDMSRMFRRAGSFNADLSNWDVSRVTNMEDMFSDASSFNPDNAPWCDRTCFR
jgi:surface protein